MPVMKWLRVDDSESFDFNFFHTMHGGVGRSALKAREEDEQARAALGLAHAEERARECAARMAAFKTALESFALSHRAEIARDPEFRRDFVRIARSIGVDPLASSKSIWASALGVGSFYFELGVRAASVCMATRAANGGLISLAELTNRLAMLGGGRGSVVGAPSQDDVLAALGKLAVLGDGFQEVKIGGTRFIRSVPDALSPDAAAVLGAVERANGCAFVDAASIISRLGWSMSRTSDALDALLRDGVAWVDKQASPPRYFFPSLNASA
jgi:ESCRT-II complex subunit VPS22